MKTVFLLFLFPILFSGCASTPVSINDAIKAAPERVIAFQTTNLTKTATLTVIRDKFYPASRCYFGFWINQTLSARIGVAEYATFQVESGEVLLRVGVDPQGSGMCGWGQDYWTQRETVMKPGDNKTFRLTMDGNGKLDIIRADVTP